MIRFYFEYDLLYFLIIGILVFFLIGFFVLIQNIDEEYLFNIQS
jgi:hypothetical protein